MLDLEKLSRLGLLVPTTALISNNRAGNEIVGVQKANEISSASAPSSRYRVEINFRLCPRSASRFERPAGHILLTLIHPTHVTSWLLCVKVINNQRDGNQLI